MDIKGKVAIVTGTSRGIGRRIAVELTRRGDVVALRARTVTPNRTIPGALGWTLDEILEAGGRAIAIPTKAVLNRLTKAIAAKLLGDNICAACLRPRQHPHRAGGRHGRPRGCSKLAGLIP